MEQLLSTAAKRKHGTESVANGDIAGKISWDPNYWAKIHARLQMNLSISPIYAIILHGTPGPVTYLQGAVEVAAFLFDIFTTFGLSLILQSDNGKELVVLVIVELVHLWPTIGLLTGDQGILLVRLSLE
ncbi:24034_t:CDS:2, partial [Gigaspora rosea]